MDEGWLESYEQWHDKEKPQREGQRLQKGQTPVRTHEITVCEWLLAAV